MNGLLPIPFFLSEGFLILASNSRIYKKNFVHNAEPILLGE
jgi:hypothetical protein